MNLLILKTILISLLIVSCSQSEHYPQHQLLDQILRVRPAKPETLSNSYSNEKGELIIEYYGYDKAFVNTLRRLEFICWIANHRYKPCEHNSKLGFCHNYDKCKGWWIFKKCKRKVKFIDIKEHEFLVQSKAKCFNRKKVY